MMISCTNGQFDQMERSVHEVPLKKELALMKLVEKPRVDEPYDVWSRTQYVSAIFTCSNHRIFSSSIISSK